MTFMRTTAGINKAEGAGKMVAQIGFADALRRFFQRGWLAISNFMAKSIKRPCGTECRSHLFEAMRIYRCYQVADALHHLWLASEGSSLSDAEPDIWKIPAALYHRLVDSLAYAA